MWVEVDLYVIDDDTDGGYGTIGLLVIDYEPRFVPASQLSIEKLERTRVKCHQQCAWFVWRRSWLVRKQLICLVHVHLYHDGCIVEWLQIEEWGLPVV